MKNDETDEARQLSRELQSVALRLITHSRTNNFRIRVEGTTPAIYLTLSEGRYSCSSESINFSAEQEANFAAAQNRSLSFFFARLRKALAVEDQSTLS